jgi:hypothetical protein
MQSESVLQAKTFKWLRAQPDLKAIRIVDRYNSGYSDIFVCLGGQTIWIELKTEIGTPSANQLLFLKEMEAVGAFCFICRSVEEVQNAINKSRAARANK